MTPNPRAVICAVVSAAVLIALLPVEAQTGSPQDTLSQYIADLQKNPNDYALREKIIRHVQTMEPKPIVSEEARKYFDRGMAAAEDAKNEKDYKDAADEFQKAVNIAPWLGAGYRGLAVTQDKCSQYSAALQNLKFFLLTNPSAEDAEKAKTLRNKIEYRMEKAAKESSPAAIAEKKQDPFEALLRKIDGRRYTCSTFRSGIGVIDVRGKVLVWGNIMPNGEYSESFCSEMRGRESPVPIDSNSPAARLGLVESTLIISEDGGRMTSRMRYKDGTAYEHIYLWQR